jgi:hypothetical protein
VSIHEVRARLGSFRFGSRSIPVLFAIITVVAYGLLLPLTGFYWDDWPFAWLARFMGPSDFIPAFRGFRPFLGPIFLITTSLVPTSPLLWQVCALVVRFLSALAAWFALRQVWSGHTRQALIASLLFLVFPGYSQHWVALTHINQEWISLIFYLLSFGFTARAVKAGSVETSRDARARRFDLRSPLLSTALALLFLFPALFPTEYFIGLEPLRFLFIWIIVAERTEGIGARFRRTLKYWWPYLLIWLVNAAWLFSYYKSGAYISYDLTAVQAAPGIAQAFLVFADALWKAGLYVWFQVLVLCTQALAAPTTLLTLIIIAAALVLTAFWLLKLDLPDSDRRFAIPALLIGLLGILLGRLPSFVAGLPLTLQSSFDRFMISMMLAASLFVAGLIELLIRNLRLRNLAFALLIALGIGQQFFNANIFRRDWVRQQEIYWQMAWRMPALKPGTALITQQMPLDYETDLSMTAAVNWIYAPDLRPASLPYALVYSEKRLGGIVLPDLKPGTPMRLPYRTVEFNGSTSQVVVIYVPSNGCLRVLDPSLGDAQTYSKFPDSLTAPIALSDPSRIIADAPQPRLPNPPFDTEPAHTWCYYYEKAELARQQQNWTQVAQLAAESAQQGLAPEDVFEWLPFIEGYARTGDVQAAEDISHSAWNAEPKLHRGLCILWQRLQTDGPPDTQHAALRLTAQWGCTP